MSCVTQQAPDQQYLGEMGAAGDPQVGAVEGRCQPCSQWPRESRIQGQAGEGNQISPFMATLQYVISDEPQVRESTQSVLH